MMSPTRMITKHNPVQHRGYRRHSGFSSISDPTTGISNSDPIVELKVCSHKYIVAAYAL